MKTLQNIITAVVFIFGTTLYAQQTPAKVQTSAYTITGATAHVGDGTVIDNASLNIDRIRIKLQFNLIKKYDNHYHLTNTLSYPDSFEYHNCE